MALQNLRSNTANKRPTASGMVDGQVAINTNATNPGLFFKDAGDGIRKVGPVFIGSSAPNSSPAAGGSSGHSIGEQWLDTSGSRYVLKTWDGTAWRDDDSNYLQLTGGALSGALTIDNAANVAALDLKFDGDTNTGFYSPSADTLGFVTGGLERARISTHGRLGIGTTSPARELSIGDGTGSPNIQLLASSSGNSRIEFGDAADSDAGEIQYVHDTNYMQFTTNGSERLRIDSSGNVGIGTSSPAVTLHVTDGTTSRSFRYRAGSNELFSSSEYNATGTTTSLLTLRSRGSSNWRHAGVVKTGNSIALLNSNTNSDITTGNGLYIDSSGNVGIGTTSPGAYSTSANNLVVQDTAGPGGITITSTTTGASNIFFADTDSTTQGRIAYQHAGDYMRFYTNASERLRIDSSGRVGIGTSSPTQKLSINGNLQFEANDGVTIGAKESLSVNLNSSGGQSNRVFQIKDNGTARVTFEQAGNVGIGTSAPSNDIHLKRTGADAILRIENTGNGNHSGIFFVREASSGTSKGAANIHVESNTGGTGTALVFGCGSNTSATGGERMRIDSSGRVGIGTTSPSTLLHLSSSSPRLQLTDTDTGVDHRLNADSSVGNFAIDVDLNSEASTPSLVCNIKGSEMLRIDSSGRVGIGTTSPNEKLVVSGNASVTDALQITSNTSAPSAGAFLFRPASNTLAFGSNSAERMRIDSSGRLLVSTTTLLENSSTAKLQITHSSGAAIALGRNDAAVTDGNDMGKIAFYGNDGGTYEMVARILCEADGSHASGDKPGRLLFQTTADGASSSTERMRIDSSGNVGIGDTAPSEKLNVAGNVMLEGSDQFLYFTNVGTGNSGIYMRGRTSTSELRSHSTGIFTWEVTGTERMRMDSSGQLGIGTSSPSSSLHVNGTSRFDNYIHFGGIISTPSTSSAIYRPADNQLAFSTANSERLRIDNSGRVGIGHSSPASLLTVGGDAISTIKPTVAIDPGNGNGSITLRRGSPTLHFDVTAGGNGTIIYDSGSDLLFKRGTLDSSTEKVRITDSGVLRVTGSDEQYTLHLYTGNTAGNTFAGMRGDNEAGIRIVGGGSYPGGGIELGGGLRNSSPGIVRFYSGTGTSVPERMRIDASGNIYIGRTSDSSSSSGTSLLASGFARHNRDGNTVMSISRGTNDGNLVIFQRAGSQKGTISVSGNTVTYGQFCGTHWGRLGDSSKPEILPGTILETINQAVEWKVIEFTVDGEQKRQAYNGSEENGASVTVEYEGASYTGTVADEEPDSEDLNKHVCVKVSDTSASKAVFGVFLGWDDQEELEANNGVLGGWNDMNIAAIGNYFIRIKSGQSLEIGDLIESDGTGCGVVQSDDIIRSKTVGKVTSTTPQQTYADGSFLVTCVLYSG